MNWDPFEYIVVGAGISGLTVAHQLNAAKKSVVVIEKDNHIGGLCRSFIDATTGIECHEYGTHVFHTSNVRVKKFISKFCTLNFYQHKVFSRFNNKTYPIPVNLSTLNLFYNFNLTPKQAKEFIQILTLEYKEPQNFEEAAIAKMGSAMYLAFIQNYSQKQWGIHPRELSASIMDRIPVRTDYAANYFNDIWQGLPLNGYSDMFSKMTVGILILTGMDFFSIRDQIPDACKIIYTGPLDKFFGYQLGYLPWRASRFEIEMLRIQDFQGCAVMNYPEASYPHIRIHEFRHLYPERKRQSFRKTIISKEYSMDWDESLSPSYPVHSDSEQARQYRELSVKQPRTFFCGRLGSYRYLNMDQAILEALTLSDRLINGE